MTAQEGMHVQALVLQSSSASRWLASQYHHPVCWHRTYFCSLCPVGSHKHSRHVLSLSSFRHVSHHSHRIASTPINLHYWLSILWYYENILCQPIMTFSLLYPRACALCFGWTYLPGENTLYDQCIPNSTFWHMFQRWIPVARSVFVPKPRVRAALRVCSPFLV